MRATISLCLTAMTFLLAAGCAGTRPVHYYTVVPTSAPGNQGAPDAPVILVGAITTSEPLQDARIRYRAGANQTGAYEYHRWTERPGGMVRDSLLRALRATGKYHVLEASSSAVGDYLVRGKLYEFCEVDQAAIQTRISLQVELVDKKTNRVVWDHLYDREDPVAAKSIPEVVESMDRNLQHVVSEVSAQIDGFLAVRR